MKPLTDDEQRNLYNMLMYLDRAMNAMPHNHSTRTFIVDKEAWYDIRKQVLRCLGMFNIPSTGQR